MSSKDKGGVLMRATHVFTGPEGVADRMGTGRVNRYETFETTEERARFLEKARKAVRVGSTEVEPTPTPPPSSQGPETDKGTGPATDKDAATRREKLAAWLADRTVDQILATSAIRGDPEVLETLLELERAGQNRSTLIKDLQQSLDEIRADDLSTEDDDSDTGDPEEEPQEEESLEEEE